MILPYARSFSRLVGSQYNARDFISGDTKLKFQDEFASKLREACRKQGIEILQALVRDIVPPDAIKDPINEREVAKQQITRSSSRSRSPRAQADLVTQEEMATQNQAIGDANKQVVTIVKKAEQERDVAVTQAQPGAGGRQAAPRGRAEAGRRDRRRGKAEANVILLNKQAEAEPLRQQVAAFGDGNAYAQYFFYQKVAPSMKSILTNTDGAVRRPVQAVRAPTGERQRRRPNAGKQQPSRGCSHEQSHDHDHQGVVDPARRRLRASYDGVQVDGDARLRRRRTRRCWSSTSSASRCRRT